jgi:NAD(P)-dependent dehydrogenase (short-subunit alcohol dehydrogenase family)
MSDQHEPIPLPPEDMVPPLPCREEFAGKVALVTGGTEGLGKHLCNALVSLGTDVFFCGRREELGKKLQAEWGQAAHFVRCDLASPGQDKAFVNKAGEFRGHLDFLVNNAAIDPVKPFQQFTAEEFDRIMEINLRSYFLVTQAAVPLLEAGAGKAVVNVCTTNYLHGWHGATAYNSAKAGIVGFSRSLAREMGPLGIRVNVVSPGWIMTARQLAEKVTEADKRDLVATQCVKTLLTAQHVTPVTLFLLSRASMGMSGQNIVVDGGKYFQ